MRERIEDQVVTVPVPRRAGGGPGAPAGAGAAHDPVAPRGTGAAPPRTPSRSGRRSTPVGGPDAGRQRSRRASAQGRAQRPVPVRLRQEVQEVPRASQVVAGAMASELGNACDEIPARPHLRRRPAGARVAPRCTPIEVDVCDDPDSRSDRLNIPDRLRGHGHRHRVARWRSRWRSTAASASSTRTCPIERAGGGGRQGQALGVRHDRRPGHHAAPTRRSPRRSR